MAEGKSEEKDKSRVRIFIDKDGICRVDPPICDAHRGESITFEAVDTSVRITFPEEQPLGKQRAHKRLNSATRSKTWQVTVRSDAEEEFEFEYAVYCDTTRKYAVGDSLPRLRIKP